MRRRNGNTIAAILLLLSIMTAGCGRITTTINPSMTATSNTTQPSSSTTKDNSGGNSASTESANGLSLSLSTDRTTYQPGQEIAIIVDEKNTLSTMNNVPATDNLPAEFMSGFTNDPSFPLGLAVLRGNYTGLNYSNVTPLIIFNPGEIYTGIIITAPASYSFEPLNDIVDLNGGDYNSSDVMWLHIEIRVNCYWLNNQSTSSNNFEPGVYTIVAGDEWGVLVILHFTVTN